MRDDISTPTPEGGSSNAFEKDKPGTNARTSAEGAVEDVKVRGGSEGKYRSLFETMGQGYCELELIRDSNGQAVDQLYLEFNPAFERLFGIPVSEARGRKASDIFPDLDPVWTETFDRVAKTGSSERMEYRVGADRWFEVFAYPGQRDRLVVLYEDVTDRKHGEMVLRESEERKAFLLALGDAMRPLTDAVEIIGAATRLLGEALGASRVYYAEWPPATDYVEIRSDYVAPGLPSLIGRYPIEFFRSTDERFREGRTWVVQDAADGTIPAAERDYCLAHGVAAWVDVPLVKGGTLQAALFLVQDAPRSWNATEIALAEETAERTWSAVARARAESSLAASEEKYRVLFDTIDTGYALTDNVRDEEGRVVDLFGVDFNRSYTQHSGLPPFAGRRASEVITVQPEWLRQFEEVTRTGVPARHENYIAERDRWVSTHYSLVGELGSDRVAVVFDDITDRKRAEAALRGSEERQAFLLALGDAMRAESAVDGKIAVAARLLGEKLEASRVLYAEYDHERGLAQIFSGWLADGAQPFPSVVKLDDFEGEVLNDLRAGRLIRVDDVGRLAAESGYAAIANVGVQALLSAPLLVDGKLKFNVSIHQHEPRHWTDDEVALVQEVSERLWAEIERARVEAAMSDREERLRLIVNSARDYAIFTIDGERNIREWLPGAEAVFGYSREEAEGQSADMLFTAEDRARGEPEKEVEGARRDGMAPDVRWHVRKGGERVFIEGQVVPLRDGGDATGFLKIGQDVTERRRAEQALRDSEERLRQFGEASSELLWIRDAKTLKMEYLSPAFERLYGVPREQVLEPNTIESWTALIHPDDRKGAADAIRQLREGISVTHEFRVIWPDGQVRWIQDSDFPLFDERGQVQRIAQDVTESRRAVEMQNTLLAELQHRVRNTLAVVRSIARRTAETSTSAPDMLAHFQGRLDAFSRVQAAVTRSREGTVQLAALVDDEMVAHAAREGEQFRIAGPDVKLDTKTAERMSLAIHELTTNAVKHGALSSDRGRLAISWDLERQGDTDTLVFRWKESGVEMDGAGERREGFGMELLLRSLPYDLQGETEVTFEPDGLAFELRLPVKAAGRGVA